MLTPQQTDELKARLQADLHRLSDHAHTAIEFTMDRDRDRIGRDSMDESTEEELYSTQLRLHDRGFKRLMARPVTTLCFECKSAREQVEAEERAE